MGGLSTRTTLYATLDYERITSQKGVSQSVEHKHYIRVGGKVIAVHSRKSSSNTTQYFHYDALNSIEAITDHQGKVLERFRYTPFGERIATQGNDNITTRGYTGHEHLAGIGLIHMNARVYDPVLQRFLSPDMIVQAPLDAQSYNRFAYVRNNPQKYTDPSGNSWWSENITRRTSSSWNGLERAVRRVSNEVRRIGRDVRAELKRLCDSGCYVSAETNGEETRVSGGGGGGQVRAPSPGTSSQSSVGVSITINSRGQISSYSAYVGYGGANFGYTTGGDYSGGELFAEGLSGDRYSIYGFGDGGVSSVANATPRGTDAEHGGDALTIRREAQVRVDRLTANVLTDWPGLKGVVRIDAVFELEPVLGRIPNGKFYGTHIDVLVGRGRPDHVLQATIFHELLHAHEAFVKHGGNFDQWLSGENGQHDPWVERSASRYEQILRYRLLGKPNLIQYVPPIFLDDPEWR